MGQSDFRIELASNPDSAGVARRFVAEHADSLPADLVEDAALLVSELVTNAVRYGRPAITLRVRLQPPLIGVEVHDEGEMLPAAVPDRVLPTARSGRGLVIVDQVSSAWGVTPTHAPPGKTVWFRLEPSDGGMTR
ncbi:MAG: ATP-binding protein [Jatrophihabitans sp.]